MCKFQVCDENEWLITVFNLAVDELGSYCRLTQQPLALSYQPSLFLLSLKGLEFKTNPVSPATHKRPAHDTLNTLYQTKAIMAQGEIKKKAAPASTKAKPMKGQKVKKPKSTKADKLQKKYTSGMVTKTEALLGERAGHLELIGKGKKAKKDEKHKGGSRKFG